VRGHVQEEGVELNVQTLIFRFNNIFIPDCGSSTSGSQYRRKYFSI